MKKKIVITGASKGIGRAIALKFAKEGFDVAVCARNAEDLEKMKAYFAKESLSLRTDVCDMSEKSQVLAYAEKLKNEFGVVDILVNNAGLFVPGLVIDEPDGTLEKIIDTNLFSAYHFSRALLPEMMKRKSGHIFNISSVAGLKAYENGGAYSISKFAMMGLSKALREELKPHNIGVTTLMPGATLTDSWSQSDLPASRFMKVEDVADLVWSISQLSENTVVEEILLRPMLGDV